MTKKKKAQKSPLAILGIVTGLTVLVINYYLLEALLPDTYVDAAYGPTILGRSFSGLAVAYNVIFAVLLLVTGYLVLNRQLAKTANQRKKRTTKRGAVVGVGESERYMRKRAIYSGGSVVAVVLLIGLFGTLTSSPSHAQSSAEPLVKLSSTTYSSVAMTKSPTGTTRFINARKDSKGKLIDTMQAGTTDGSYLYFAYENSTAGGVIAKYDLSGKLLKKSQVYKPSAIGHANGFTYNSRLQKLILVTYQPDGNKVYHRDRLAYVDPTTLEITSYVTVSPSASISNVCYNATTDQYVSNGWLYDSSFKLIKKNLYNLSVMNSFGDKDSAGQGITCDASKIYVIRYYASKTKPHTNVYAYDWSGNLTAVYRVKDLKDEAENVFILNGKLYMGVNNGSTYLGKSSDNRNDYYIRLNDIPVN